MSLVWLSIAWSLFLAALSAAMGFGLIRERSIIQIAVCGSVVIAIGWLICVLVF